MTEKHIDRRTMLRGAAAATGLAVWTAPAITSVAHAHGPASGPPRDLNMLIFIYAKTRANGVEISRHIVKVLWQQVQPAPQPIEAAEAFGGGQWTVQTGRSYPKNVCPGQTLPSLSNVAAGQAAVVNPRSTLRPTFEWTADDAGAAQVVYKPPARHKLITVVCLCGARFEQCEIIEAKKLPRRRRDQAYIIDRCGT